MKTVSVLVMKAAKAAKDYYLSLEMSSIKLSISFGFVKSSAVFCVITHLPVVASISLRALPATAPPFWRADGFR